MKFIVEKAIFEKLPNACFGVVMARGIDNSKAYPAIDRLLDESITVAAQRFEGKKVKEEPDILPYREAFRALDINPNKYLCSIEALFTRIAKGKCGFSEIHAPDGRTRFGRQQRGHLSSFRSTRRYLSPVRRRSRGNAGQRRGRLCSRASGAHPPVYRDEADQGHDRRNIQARVRRIRQYLRQLPEIRCVSGRVRHEQRRNQAPQYPGFPLDNSLFRVV